MKTEPRGSKGEWPKVAIDQVAELNPRLPEALTPEDDVSFVPMAAVSAETAGITQEERRTYAQVSKGFTPFVSGDVLVAKITPCFENGKIAQVLLTRRYGFGSTEFHVIRPHTNKLDARYTLHFLRQRHVRLAGERRMTGSAGQRRVPADFFAKLKIPLPPLAEQRRIAEVLDRAEALRAKRCAALAQLDSLTQSLFLDLFGDPVANPKGWPDPSLGSSLTFQLYGPRFYNETYNDAGIRIVRITDLDEAGNLDFDSMPRLVVCEEDIAKYALLPGDIIFARTGATVGKVALIKDGDPPCIAGAYFIVMRFSDALLPTFVRSVLTSDSVRSIVATRSRQAAQQNFSGPGLRALPMPIPPIELQREFARRVTAVETLKTAHRASLAELDALFATLQHRAFRGEL